MMKDVSTKIKYKGKEYKLVFNLNVMEEIQEEFGSIEKWGKMCEPSSMGKEPSIKALKYGLTAMLNEGTEIVNEETGGNDPLLTLKQVGRMISCMGVSDVSNTLAGTVMKSVQLNAKNALSTKKK